MFSARNHLISTTLLGVELATQLKPGRYTQIIIIQLHISEGWNLCFLFVSLGVLDVMCPLLWSIKAVIVSSLGYLLSSIYQTFLNANYHKNRFRNC